MILEQKDLDELRRLVALNEGKGTIELFIENDGFAFLFHYGPGHRARQVRKFYVGWAGDELTYISAI